MISDHMWLDGADAQRVIRLVPTAEHPIVLEAFAERTRPKRGLKVFAVNWGSTCRSTRVGSTGTVR